jgi:hypothetical protein
MIFFFFYVMERLGYSMVVNIYIYINAKIYLSFFICNGKIRI